MADRPLFIRTEPFDDEPLSWLEERAIVVAATPDTPDFAANAALARGLLVRTYTIVDESLLDRLPALRVVARAGVGLDNVDVDACRRRGVEVVHTPDANSQAVVEFVLAITCDAIRPRLFLDDVPEPTEWSRLRAEVVGERQFDERTIGVLGFGRIGSRVARVFDALGCRVLFHDLRGVTDEERGAATPVRCTELFERADLLTIHVDGRSSNHGLVGADLLGRMREDAILVNTSRGFVVDRRALARHLRARPATTALLDVHDPEPIPADDPLVGLANAHLSPHLASRTRSAMRAMSWVVRDAWAVVIGERPRWPAPTASTGSSVS